MDLLQQAIAFAYDTKQVRWIAPLLWLVDAVLTAAIIKYIPYTEIDWKAYMQQIVTYLAGERDYNKIRGDTGPLVYPGGHVYIYRALFYLTDQGSDIQKAQWIFAALYLSTLALVMLVYRQAKAPPILFPLLILSKRVHSIYTLRLFNDCFAVFFLFLAIYAYQRRMWTLGSIAYSTGLGVKMSLLLALPAVGAMLWQAQGRNSALKQALIIAQWQVLLGHDFLVQHPWSYLGAAFEFSRQFLFKWTVNWRFVGEEIFLSRPFSVALLLAHVVLITCALHARWLRPAGLTVLGVPRALMKKLSLAEQQQISRRVTPAFIANAILGSIVIGCLCARSLHYQFYAYIVWSTPLLLWQAGEGPIWIVGTWITQEWAWNVYPSTRGSSLLAVLALGFVVLVHLTQKLVALPETAVVDQIAKDKKST